MGQCISVLDQRVAVDGEETLLVAGELGEEERELVNTPAGRHARVTN